MTWTLIFDLDKLAKGQNLKQQLWKTCQNVLGYYAYGIIYYWRSFALYEHGVSSFRCFRLL